MHDDIRRCRYTQDALANGISTFRGQREGEFIRSSRDGRTVKVRWDGNKSVYSYHRDFIEIISEQSGICVVDLSRAPILRELLIEAALKKGSIRCTKEALGSRSVTRT